MAQSVSSTDNYPPSRVSDLYVVDVFQTNPEKSVTIQFTSPGDDLDFGTGKQLKFNTNINYQQIIVLFFCFFLNWHSF